MRPFEARRLVLFDRVGCRYEPIVRRLKQRRRRITHRVVQKPVEDLGNAGAEGAEVVGPDFAAEQVSVYDQLIRYS